MGSLEEVTGSRVEDGILLGKTRSSPAAGLVESSRVVLWGLKYGAWKDGRRRCLFRCGRLSVRIAEAAGSG